MKEQILRRNFLKTAELSVVCVITSILLSGCPYSNNISPNKIYITVDDGPRGYMEEMLDLFAQTGDRATFFVVGQNCEDDHGYSLLVRALNEGHLIGNHSYSHPNFQEISDEEAEFQVKATYEITDQAYEETGRFNPKLFRFPFGAEANHSAVLNAGYGVVRWDVDPQDYNLDASKWTNNEIEEVCLSAQTGDIILLHDLENTARVVIPSILEYYTSGVIR
jgi:peptidoglycan/xylan/chitin deacetylase (PgdA/CDA1 family)